MSLESRKKMSDAKKNYFDPVKIEKMRLANLGSKRSDEYRAKLSKAQMGKKHTEQSKKKMTLYQQRVNGKKVQQIFPNGNEVQFESIGDAAKKTPYSKSTISEICNNKRESTRDGIKFIFLRT